MRNNVLMFVLLVAYPASTQISSGTVVVFNFTEDKLIVAADSRVVHNDATPPDNAYCKISTLGHQFVFVTFGHTSYANTPFDLIKGWDNLALARETIQVVSKKDDTAAYLIDLATYWAKAVRDHWDRFCALRRSECEKLVEKTNGILTQGMFIGSNTLFGGAGLVFNPRLPSPVYYVTGDKMTQSQCWSCGQEPGKKICVAGSHPDIAANMCAKRGSNSKISTRLQLPGLDRDTGLAVEIAELTIAAYGKSVGDVGGPIDIISIPKSGSIHWINHKHNCPDY
jgi:hypothetical protein